MSNNYDFVAIKEAVRRRLSAKRFTHVLGVVEMAGQLADTWGEDEEKARLAAYLHDIAREDTNNYLLKQVLDFGIVVDEIERREPFLLHGPVGAAIAKHEYGVEDPEVLAAIRYHTTGRAAMSKLEQIVYVADAIEPGRSFKEVNRWRQLASRNLDSTVLAIVDDSLTYLLRQRRLVHPDSVAAHNYYLKLLS